MLTMAASLSFLVAIASICVQVGAFQAGGTFGFGHRKALSSLAASVQAGDTVLVIGGTSGIGQLVTQKLAATGLSVRATSRSKARGEELLSGSSPSSVQVVELDLLQEDTGPLKAAMQGVSAIVVSVGTTAFPTMRWRGGNTPQAIDKDAVIRISKAAANESSVQQVVIVTSVGVDRTKEMPFAILNLFGVLDAKKAGEDAIKTAAASDSGFDYVIVRPGRLVGGPFTNLDVAKLLQIEGGAENGVDVAVGDCLLGDCKRDACAECIVQCLTNTAATNLEFSIVSNEGKALTDDQWTETFQNMLGTMII
jgi:nucleoside-diphosphate-sugar epimerase